MRGTSADEREFLFDTAGLEAGFEALAGAGDGWVRDFFARLFERHSDLGAVFAQSPPEAYERPLVAALVTLVDAHRDPAALKRSLRALGRRHAGYGAREEHYASFRESLLEAMMRSAGTAFSPRARNAWDDALQQVTAVMSASGATRPLLRPRRAETEAQEAVPVAGSGRSVPELFARQVADRIIRIRDANTRAGRRLRLQRAALASAQHASDELQEAEGAETAPRDTDASLDDETSQRLEAEARQLAEWGRALGRDTETRADLQNELEEFAVDLHLVTVAACAEAARAPRSAGIGRIAEHLQRLDRRLAARGAGKTNDRPDTAANLADRLREAARRLRDLVAREKIEARAGTRQASKPTQRESAAVERLSRALVRLETLIEQNQACVDEVHALTREQGGSAEAAAPQPRRAAESTPLDAPNSPIAQPIAPS